MENNFNENSENEKFGEYIEFPKSTDEQIKKDFYQKLRVQIKEWLKTKNGKENKWADYLMFAPDLFHLLCKLTLDREVPTAVKIKLVAALAYFVSPIDLVPEAIVGVVGYVDDIALAAYVLNGLVNTPEESILYKHWAGDKDVLEVIRQILEIADSMLGSGMWKRLKDGISKA